MNVTLDIDDELLVKAKAVSARERTSLNALIEESLRLRLRTCSYEEPRSRLPLPIYRGQSGLAQGLDPTSNRSMLDAAGDDA